MSRVQLDYLLLILAVQRGQRSFALQQKGLSSID